MKNKISVIKNIIRKAFIKLPTSLKVIILVRLKPISISVEPTNNCNIRCPFCATTTGLERSKGTLRLENYKKIVDQVNGYVKTIWIYFMGEPLLNKELYGMIRSTVDAGITPKFITNGQLLKRNVDKLIHSGMPSIRVALDGYNKETHEKYRVKSDFDTIINGIKALEKRKKELGIKTPEVVIQTLAFGYNDEYKMRELAQSLGVAGIKVKSPRIGDYKQDISEKVMKEFLPKEKKHVRVKGQNQKPFARDYGYCPWMRNPVITWDGNVLPCCFDWHGKEVMGNIFEQNLDEILQGSRSKEVKKKYFRGELSICEKCDAIVDF
jgi:radical SAM protein with 4Fe4S-binding SPASM domain